jgi:lipoprotein-anchoring transpeptidase ErfK/SrfK
MSAQPRYGRIATLGASVVVTAVTVLGGLGVLPAGGGPSYAATRESAASTADRAALTAAQQREIPDVQPVDLSVPADSGEGRRVVFDQGAQRVWLVKADGSVERTYLVSGSIYDNLDPGTYSVYSRSMQAWGVEDSGTMRYMVRFAYGAEAPIGFHDIPVLDGEKVQTRDELGTPRSHGCVRQKTPDAQALWKFAPLGTTVVVVDTVPDVPDRSAES